MKTINNMPQSNPYFLQKRCCLIFTFCDAMKGRRDAINTCRDAGNSFGHAIDHLATYESVTAMQ